jgi:hypothetical protein
MVPLVLSGLRRELVVPGVLISTCNEDAAVRAVRERVRRNMAVPLEKCPSPSCVFSHHVINQLTAIIGNCDILRELAEHLQAPDKQCLKRLETIRNLAMKLAGEMNTHMCALNLETKARLLPQKGENTRARKQLRVDRASFGIL